MTRSAQPCDDDRLVRLRRGVEWTQDLEMFTEHLRVCDDCWSAWFAWRSLEADGAARPGDEEIRGPRRRPSAARLAARDAACAADGAGGGGRDPVDRHDGQRQRLSVSPVGDAVGRRPSTASLLGFRDTAQTGGGRATPGGDIRVRAPGDGRATCGGTSGGQARTPIRSQRSNRPPLRRRPAPP